MLNGSTKLAILNNGIAFMEKDEFLSVKNLTISFVNSKKPTVHGVSFAINSGETLALVGESGSGKTLIAESIMRLRPNVLVSGEILLDQQSLLHLSPSELMPIRRNRVSYIF
jgi:microcin C transport system ATP-binding protein